MLALEPANSTMSSLPSFSVYFIGGYSAAPGWYGMALARSSWYQVFLGGSARAATATRRAIST